MALGSHARQPAGDWLTGGGGPPVFPARRRAAGCLGEACWGSHVHPETRRGDALGTREPSPTAGDCVTPPPPHASGCAGRGQREAHVCPSWGSGTPAQGGNREEKLLFAKPQSGNELPRAEGSGLGWNAGEGTPRCSARTGRGRPPPAAALTGTPGAEYGEARWLCRPTAGAAASFLAVSLNRCVLHANHEPGVTRGVCAGACRQGQGLRGL